MIMGCTHYPLLSGLLQLELGPDVVLVSSAEETAKDVYAELLRTRRACGPRTSRRTTRSSPRATRRRSTIWRSCSWGGRSRRSMPRTSRREEAREADRPGLAGHVAGRVPRVLRLPRQRRGVHPVARRRHRHVRAPAGAHAGRGARRHADLPRARRPFPRHHPGLLRAPLRRARGPGSALLLATRVHRPRGVARVRGRAQRHGAGLRFHPRHPGRRSSRSGRSA